MKLEDFAYAIAQKLFQELEHGHHFVVPEAVQKAVIEKILKSLNTLVK